MPKKDKLPPAYVDRDEFKMWTEGILLMRNTKTCRAPDELKCQAAEKRLISGGEVVLTVNDRPFSLLHLDKKSEAYIEEEIECVVLKKKKKLAKKR